LTRGERVLAVKSVDEVSSEVRNLDPDKVGTEERVSAGERENDEREFNALTTD
jgi:hypothetical protein